MGNANHDLFNAYLSKKQVRNVTTRSVVDLLVLSSLPKDVKTLVL